MKKTFGDKLSIIGIVGVRHYELNDYDGPKIEFGSGADSKRRLADLADVSSVPSVMLVDQHGIVRYVGHPGTLNEGVVQKILGLTPAPAAEK